MNALVTGASQGIGYHTALELARQGHSVFAIARSEQNLTELQTQAESEKLPGRIHIYSTDLTGASSIDSLVKWLASRAKALHILVNNAGILINMPFAETTSSELEATFNVNVFVPFRLTLALLPHLKEAGSAHIINIGSMGGVQGSAKFPGLAAYSASKGALAILSECIAEELKETTVKCNCLALGAAQTDMLSSAFPGYEAPVTGESIGKYIADFALNGSNYYNGKILSVSLSTP